MATFALIAEGLTDQIAIEHIIEQVCSDMFEDGVDVNPLQPLRDATDNKRAPHGGWELVLEYCRDQASNALEANDFVVVHIDTDSGEHQNYGLKLMDDDGKERSYDSLVEGAKSIIVSRIGDDLYKKHAKRFIFAISVHTMESWLLLCLYNEDNPKNSHYKLNRLLAKDNCKPIAKHKDDYQVAMKSVKAKFLKGLPRNSSLGLFIDELKSLSI